MKHPATFSTAILEVIDELLDDARLVLDPFAGVGGVHALSVPSTRNTYGVEIEKEWADTDYRTVHGSALDLPWGNDVFDAVATSPTYGNRMADTYDGRDGSTRSTYRIALGRPLDDENSGGLQWGLAYRVFHLKAWVEAVRVLKPGGRFVLNCKDHIRGGVQQGVTDWHVSVLEILGLGVHDWRRVPARGYGYGANSTARVDAEDVVLLLN